MSFEKETDAHTLLILKSYFGELPENEASVFGRLELKKLAGGDWLFRQGDPGDSVYVLVRGRLQVWLEADDNGLLEEHRLIGRVTPGESVGEIGLLTKAPRGAGIRAIRDSKLVRISRKVFEELSQQHPELILRLAGRAAALVHQSASPASGVTRNLRAVALLPLDNTIRTREFCADLCERLEMHGKIKVLHAAGLPDAGAPVSELQAGRAIPESLLHWVHEQEDAHRLLVFQCGAEASNWTRFALRQSDLTLLVGEYGSEPRPRDWEQQLGLLDERSNLRRVLVLLQGSSEEIIENTADWFKGRHLDFHLHVRKDRSDDLLRVARVVAGEATGLVLGAGASRGFAHLGVYRALVEAGIPIDWIGGTSIGAIMGALMAMDRSPQQCIDQARQSFVGGKPFSDFTLPLVSLLAGQRMRRLIRSQAAWNIEDMPLPFFCVSSNLDDGSINLHQQGNLAGALEATASMPGIFPPSVVAQRLAVDGSVLNSLPVDLMWQQAVGQVIASDLAAQLSRTVDYKEIPSSWALLRSRVLPFGTRYRVPGLMNVMLKSTELATLQNVRAQGQRASLLLQPDVRRFGLTQVAAFDKIVEEGYLYTCDRIQGWTNPIP